MTKYEIKFMCEHIETVTITARTEKQAIQKVIENGEYEEVLGWHLDGNRFLQSSRKAGETT